MGHGDHGHHDRPVGRLPRHLGHEGPVDLEPVEGEVPQAGEHGVARAEVVDGHPDPEGAQFLQGQTVVVLLLHRHALGHLDLEALRVEPGLPQHVGHRLPETAVMEVAAGDVHRHPDGRKPAVRPGLRLLAGRPHDPRVERHDQAAVLGHRDELVGADPSELGAAISLIGNRCQFGITCGW